jgi:hypothetical protein
LSETGTGELQNITLPSSASSATLIVQINGVLQRPNIDYSVFGTTLTITTNDPGDNILIMSNPLVSTISTPSMQFLLPNGSSPSRTYFVSNDGNDSNNGTSPLTPWKTISKVNSGPSGGYLSGDAIRFAGGQSFSGSVQVLSSSVFPLSANMTIGTYGTGQATINVPAANWGFFVRDVGNLSIRDFIIINSDANAGIYCENQSTTTQLGSLSFYNLDISGGSEGIDIENWNETSSTASTKGWDTVTIDKCYIHPVITNGLPGIFMFVNQVAGTYGFTNVTVKNCEITSCGSNGMDIRSTNGLTIQNNYIHDNGGHAVGGVAIEFQNCNNTTVQYNEISGQVINTGASDSCGVDVDLDNTNTIVRFNYIHDNAGAGIALQQTTSGTWSDCDVYMNVLWNNNLSSTNLNGAIVVGVPSQNMMSGVRIYNNTIYNNQGATDVYALILVNTVTPSGYVANNILYSGGNPRIVISNQNASSLLFRGNSHFGSTHYKWNGTAYTTFSAWQTATTQEQISGSNVALTSDPKLTTPGNTGGSLGKDKVVQHWVPTSLTAMRLQSSSPCLGAGQNLTTFSITNPTADFFNKFYPNAAGYTIGADGI